MAFEKDLITTAPARAYAAALTELNNGYTYRADPGATQNRIVQINEFGQESAHAFVKMATGDVHMAAGWVGPAKPVRGNVATPEGLAELIERARNSRTYLYARG